MGKHILFDFDGTIADSRLLLVKLYNELARQHRFRLIREEDLPLLRSLSAGKKMELLGVPLLQVPMLAAAAKRRYQERIGEVTLVPGIREVLQSLTEQGGKLTILSSNSSAAIRQFLKRHKLESRFGAVLTASPLAGKRSAIRKFLRREALPASRTVYVGDELRDIEACRKLAMPVIAVTWGYDAADLLQRGKPDYLVNRPTELLETLKTLTTR